MSCIPSRVSRVALSLLAAATLAAGCGSDETPTPSPDAPSIPEEKLAGVHAFPNPERLVKTVESLPLEAAGSPGEAPGKLPETVAVGSIVTVGPDGAPTGVEIGFNQPMKTFDGARPLTDDGPVVLTPAVAGTLSWVNDATLAFRPDAPLPVATGFTVSVPTGRGLVAASGKPLDAGDELAFETTRLEVSWAPYSSWDYPASREPSGTLAVELNQPVAIQDVERLVRVVTSRSKDALSSGRGDAIAFTARPLPTGEDQAVRNGFELVPEGGFEVGAWYVVTLPTTLHGPGPLGLAEPRQIIARGPEQLGVSYASCGYDTCTPDAEWSISFANALVAATVPGCISLGPAARVEDVKVDGSYVTFRALGLRPNTKATLRVSTACTDVYGTHLARPFSAVFEVAEQPARLSMSEGSGYLEPAPEGEPVAIELGAHASGKLTVRRLRVTADQLGAVITGALGEYGGVDLADIEGGATTTLPGPGADAPGLARIPLAIDDLLGADNRGVVFVEVHAERKGAWGDPPVRRALVQVTDTAVTAKTSAQDTVIWTTSLATSAPIGGAQVALLDASGKELWKGVTDGEGLARAPSNAVLDGKPRIVVASSGGDDLSFVDLEDWSTRIDPYRFDLPYAWEPQADVIRGFVFTERGVYRAGEKVYVKGYMRLDRGRTLELPPDPQVTVEVTDPMGETAFTQNVQLDALAGFDVSFDLDQGASLGAWSVQVRPAGDGDIDGSGQGSFRVEAYRPNRFEVKVLDPVRTADAVTARVSGRYLYGAPMSGAKVRWWATRIGDDFSPAGFEGYAFGQATDRWWWEPDERSSATLGQGNGVLSDDGTLDVSAALGELDFSDGPLGVIVEAEVVDVDEQVVAGRTRLRLDPGAFYVGVARGESIAEAGKPFEASVVAVSPEGEQLAGKTLTVTLKKRTWESVKKAAAGGGTTWVSEAKDTAVATATLTSAARGPVTTPFTAPSPGTYVVEATADDGAGHALVSSEELWVWGNGEGWWARSDDERLTVIAEKERYAVGDVARFLVQSPFPTAHALVTVERQGVLWQKVVDVEGGAPLIEVPITEEMQPNAFVSFTLVRGRVEAADSDPDKGRPASKIGYARIGVDLDDKTLTVGVTPDAPRHRPGETVKATLTLADADGHPVAGQVTFYAVDEGVLQLTGYRTPNALAAFFAPQPLSVSTVETRRRLWARIDPTDDGMKSDWGGGGDDEEAGTNYRSAFATTAVFLPSVEIGSDGRADVAFTLPDNLGAFRLMAVAAADGNRFGRADTRVEVSKPILVRPGLPRFVSSGDEFEARAVVQAIENAGSGEVVVELSASGPVELLEASSVTATLSRGKAEAITFRARAKAPGTATFAFKVTPAGATEAADAVKVEIPVQFPASVRTAIESGRVAGEHGVDGLAARRIEVPDWVRADVGGVDVEIASSQLGELLPGLRYLVRYPYGCVEQTTGVTLPLLALGTMSEDFALPGIDHAQVLARAQAGVDRLRTMQQFNGGLSYWPGGNEAHPWGSAYGGLALVRASKVPGLTVPEGAVEGVKTFLRSLLAGQYKPEQSEWAAEMHPVEPFAAYVLAVAGDPDAGSVSRLFEQRATLPDFGRALLALAIAEAGGDAGMLKTLTDELLAEVRVDGDQAFVQRRSKLYWSTMDSDVRSGALILMALLRARPEDPTVARLARGLLAERRHGRWMSTQDNAMAILALGDYFRQTEKPGASYLATVRLDGEILLSERMASASMAPHQVHIPMTTLQKASGKLLTITREGDDAPLYYTLTFDYAPTDIPKIPIHRGFALQREYVFADGPRKGEKVSSLKAGDVVEVRLAVTTPERRRYVAIDDPLPAGLEPVNTGFDTTGNHDDIGLESSWIFDHSEQQDDRVAIFANDMPAGTYRHSYLARATTTGTFIAPAARVHEMYHPDVFGQAAARDMTVVD
ncbi:MAG: hypothetical protein EP329_22365 [Deltaproteobacteria bacterium]|nr:MAG: hypothetical protein EP329_22365 [Deltaproteobacteria bacterium]